MLEYFRQPMGGEEITTVLSQILTLSLFTDCISIFKQITPTTECYDVYSHTNRHKYRYEDIECTKYHTNRLETIVRRQGMADKFGEEAWSQDRGCFTTILKN